MSASLKPWYAIATPHEDIRKGRLAEVVFAANIWAPVQDIAPEVHLDPRENRGENRKPSPLFPLLLYGYSKRSGSQNA